MAKNHSQQAERMQEQTNARATSRDDASKDRLELRYPSGKKLEAELGLKQMAAELAERWKEELCQNEAQSQPLTNGELR